MPLSSEWPAVRGWAVPAFFAILHLIVGAHVASPMLRDPHVRVEHGLRNADDSWVAQVPSPNKTLFIMNVGWVARQRDLFSGLSTGSTVAGG